MFDGQTLQGGVGDHAHPSAGRHHVRLLDRLPSTTSMTADSKEGLILTKIPTIKLVAQAIIFNQSRTICLKT